jgi:thiol-disulfide isomerase/thioredoxin
MRRHLLAALLLLGLVPPALAEEPAPAADPEPRKVYRLPDFRVRTLDGEWFDSASGRDGALLIDFWATWCAPCLAVAPAMDRLYRDFRVRGLRMIGIAVDSGTAEEVARAAGENEMSYPQALWNQDLAERIQGLQAVPTYILVRPDGTIARLWIGATSPLLIRRELEALLPGDGPKASR